MGLPFVDFPDAKLLAPAASAIHGRRFDNHAEPFSLHAISGQLIFVISPSRPLAKAQVKLYMLPYYK
ncbi:MAG TPA: hypothetical protein VE079_00190 [Ensifer sp.]|nr:hypothetical protein [Ensifer sp.]